MTLFKKIKALLVGSGEVGGFEKPDQKVLARSAQQQATHDVGLMRERERKELEKVKQEEAVRVEDRKEGEGTSTT